MELCIKKGGRANIQNNLNVPSDQITKKNLDVISVLTGNNNLEDFRTRLDSFRVKIILQDSVKNSDNFKNACYVALNLLPRIFKSVQYVGDREILKMFQPSHSLKINLGIRDWKSDITLVFGNIVEPNEQNVLYIGSSGWSVYLSKNKPCDWHIEQNNISALYVGALAVGESFKQFLPELNPNKLTDFMYDLITHGQAPQPVVEPKLPEIIDYGDLLIIGCGAIGQAFCLTIKLATKLSGKIRLIDNDNLEPSNEQRYLSAYEEFRGNNKAVLMGNLLSNGNTTCIPVMIPLKYEDYANSSSGFIDREVVVMVDNIWTRLNVQAGLPKILWNGWTDVSARSLRYGIGHHIIDGNYECLGCAYYPTGLSPTEMELNSIMTGLTQDEIKHKLEQNAACTLQDIQRISQNTGIPIQRLLPNQNKPFRNLLHGDCGVFTLRLKGQDVIAPAPHVPALAGILLASQLILRKLNIPKESKLIESADYDAFQDPNLDSIINAKKEPRCFCNDPDYQQAYSYKWNMTKKKC